MNETQDYAGIVERFERDETLARMVNERLNSPRGNSVQRSYVSNSSQIVRDQNRNPNLRRTLSRQSFSRARRNLLDLAGQVLASPQRNQGRTTSQPVWRNPSTETNQNTYRNISRSYSRRVNESIAEPPEDADDSIFEQSTVLEQTVLEPLPIIETNNNRIEIPQKFLPLKKYQKESIKPPKLIQTCKDLLAKEGSKFSEDGKKLLQNVVAQMEADFQLIKALKMEVNEMQEDMDLLSERFSCGICCNSFAEVSPVTLSRCNHVFCQFCIEKVTECPACRKPIYYGSTKPLYFV